MYKREVYLILTLITFNKGIGIEVEGNHETFWNNNHNVQTIANLLTPENVILNIKAAHVYKANQSNSTCYRDLSLLSQALAGNVSGASLWAWKMLDASSKVPSGILEGNLMDLGMYDECLKIHETVLGNVSIRGRHCMYAPNFMRANESLLPQLPIKLSICLPTSCDANDVINVIGSINTVLPWKDIEISVNSVTCSSIDEKVWDTKFIVFLSLFVILVCFLLGCSFYDALEKTEDEKVNVFKQLSLQRNAAAILNTKVKQDNLPAIHGLRVFSTAWVTLGHEYILNFAGATLNTVDILAWFRSWESLYIFTAPFAVDTFFTLSGFLMTYLFLKQIPKHSKFNIPSYYIHRYVRLTPAVIALLIFSIFFIPKLGSGPLWDSHTNMLMGKCREKWWPIMLYLQNFVEKDNICLAHLWYLAVDMQLFWISPIILYPLYKVPKIGLAIVTVLFGASIVTTALIIGINEYPAVSLIQNGNTSKLLKMFQNAYEVPYTRAGPWLIGIFLGFEVANKHRKLTHSLVILGWLLTLVAFSFCILGTKYFMEPSYEYDAIAETFFSTISRSVWALGICWIIFASVNNRAGILQRILCWKALIPLSRLTYCIYLVHFVIMVLHRASIRSPSYFTNYIVWRSYFSNFVISVIVAFLFSLLFESPILVLERTIRKRLQ